MDVSFPESSATRPGGPGRPRGFDAEAALDRALAVFWQKGYEGASLTDLTEAMGINRPSLYAAFGNKEALFRKALGRYLAGPAATLAQTLEQADTRQAITAYLEAAARLLTCPGHPSGCLVVQGALSCGEAGDVIRAELAGHRRSGLELLRQRLATGRAAGEVPADCDIDALARYVATVHQGLSVQAASGATCEELLAVVGIALRQWPGA
jgi:AcrR family transcriptional regulator